MICARYAVHLPVCVNCQFLSDTDFKTVKRTALFMSFSAFLLHNKSSHHIFLPILLLVNDFHPTYNLFIRSNPDPESTNPFSPKKLQFVLICSKRNAFWESDKKLIFHFKKTCSFSRKTPGFIISRLDVWSDEQAIRKWVIWILPLSVFINVNFNFMLFYRHHHNA